MRRFTKYFLLFALIFAASCSDGKIIRDKQKFASLYIDLQLILEKNRGDFNKIKSEKAKIYQKYNLTDEQYRATIASLEQDTGKWNQFFSAVNAKLYKMKKKT